MDFRKNDSAGFLVNHMARLFAKGLQDRITAFGITTGQFPILLELWEEDGLRQSELVARINVEQATVANTLNRMERDGLIKRTKHPSDARAQQITLTDKALAIKDRAYEAANTQNKLALSGLSKTEQETFLRISRQIIQAMKDKQT